MQGEAGGDGRVRLTPLYRVRFSYPEEWGVTVDGTFLPDFQGVIETDDGATILFDLRGFGRAYPPGARQIVVAVTHVSDDDRYRRLNDVLAVGAGEVRSQGDGPAEPVIDVAELVWEAMGP